jgi:16S rRNA processing protein RimM
MATAAPEDRLVCLAVVRAAHGVRGAFKLRCFTAAPESVAAYGPLLDERGRELFALEVVGRVADGIIARAPGIRDRDAADALRGTRLHVPRSRLPATAPDEFYHDDLIGLEAVTAEGRSLGRVAAVLDFGAGEILEIVGAEGAVLDLPFTRAVVPSIDLAARRLVVRPPAEIIAGPGR